MEIKAIDVKRLRDMTSAGMMDCKKALVEALGDFERAKEIIREKGKLVAEKRADRTTSEGKVIALTDAANKKGIIVALGCETDFVSKNADFQALADAIAAVKKAAVAKFDETQISVTVPQISIASGSSSSQTISKKGLQFLKPNEGLLTLTSTYWSISSTTSQPDVS